MENLLAQLFKLCGMLFKLKHCTNMLVLKPQQEWNSILAHFVLLAHFECA